MAYSVTSDKSGKTYYLHSKAVELKNTKTARTIYFFKTDDKGSIDLPEGWQAIQNPRSGLPFLKKAASS